MGIKLADAIVYISGDKSKLKKDFSGAEKETKGWVSRLGGSVKKLMGGIIKMGAMAATGAVVGLGASLVSMTMDAAAVEGVTATFDKLVASVGGDAVTAMDELRGATRGMVADADLMSAGNKFFAMGLADSSEKAAELAEVATQLGMAMGEDATDSMENFALMLANQSIPRLDSFGISSSVVRERILELTEANEGMGRETAFMQAVMEQAQATMAKVGEQGDTTKASMDRIKAGIANLKLGIGKAFLPMWDMMVTALSGFVDEHGPKLQEWAASAAEWLGENIPRAIETMRGFWTDTLEPALRVVWDFVTGSLVPSFVTVYDWLATNIPLAIETVSVWLQETLGPVVEEAAGFWTDTLEPALRVVWDFITANVVPALETVAGWLGEKMGVAIEAAQTYWTETLKPALEESWQFINDNLVPTLEYLVAWLEINIPRAITVLTEIWNGIFKPALEGLVAFVDDNLMLVLAALAVLVLTTVVPPFVAWAAATLVAMAPIIALGVAVVALGLIWNEHGEKIMTTVEQLKVIIIYALNQAAETVKQMAFIVQFYWEAIKDKAIELWTSLTTTWEQIKFIIMYYVNELATGLSDFITNGIEGWQTAWEDLKLAVTLIIGNIYTAINDKIDEIATTLSDFITNGIEGWQTAWEDLQTAVALIIVGIYTSVTDTVDSIKTFIEDFDLVATGTALIQGLIDGIKNMAQSAIDAVTGVVGGAIQGAKNLLGIESPSKVFAQLGQQTVAGFTNALDALAPKVELSMQAVMGGGVQAATGGTQSNFYGPVILEGVQDAPGLLTQLQEMV